MRKESPGYYSIERLFESLAVFLSEDFELKIIRVPHRSSGAWSCLRNVLFTARLRADVIHITGDIHYCALAVRRKCCVLTIHDLHYLGRLVGLRKLVFSIAWYKLPLRWARYVTAISDETKRQIEQAFPRTCGEINVIPNCVDPLLWADCASAGNDSRKLQILQVGTSKNKNLERVAKAASALSLHLRIIGSLNRAQLEMLGSTGVDWSSVAGLTTEELLLEYQSSSVLMFASTREGFGLPILEAQAQCLPVITSNVQPMKDVAGDGALFVNPYDELDIQRSLQAVLQSLSLASHLVERGKRNAERFEARAVAKKYSDIYRRVLAT